MSKALFLTQENPFPPRGSDKFRDFHVLKLLCEKDRRSGAALPHSRTNPSGLRTAARASQESRRSPRSTRKPELSAKNLLRPRALNIYAESVERELQKRAEPGKLLWISRLLMASCVPLARSLGYHVILDEHNVESALLQTVSRLAAQENPQFHRRRASRLLRKPILPQIQCGRRREQYRCDPALEDRSRRSRSHHSEHGRSFEL